MRYANVVIALLLLASCATPLDEKERTCPCSSGWACCKLTNTCVAEESYDVLCGSKEDVGVNTVDKVDAGEDAHKPSTDGAQPIVCVPRDTECVDLKVRRACNDSGTAWSETPCSNGHRCDSGSCVAADEIVASLRFSVSVKAKDLILDIDPGEYTTTVGLTAEFRYDADALVGPPNKGPEGCYKRNNTGSGAGAAQSSGVRFDAGDIAISGPFGAYTYTYDSDKEVYSSKIKTFDSYTSPFPGFGKPLTISGAGKNLVGAFTTIVTLPPERLLTRPGPREELEIEKNAPFELQWSGATKTGQIGFDLLGLPEEIPPGTWTPKDVVRCEVDDDGSFTVPASIMSTFESYPKVMLIMRMSEHQPSLSAEGLTDSEVIVDYYYWPSKTVLLSP